MTATLPTICVLIVAIFSITDIGSNIGRRP